MNLPDGAGTRSPAVLALVVAAVLSCWVYAAMHAESGGSPRGAEETGLGAGPESLEGGEGTAATQVHSGEAAAAAGRENGYPPVQSGQRLPQGNFRRWLLLAVSWILLIVGLLLVILALGKSLHWLFTVRRARRPPNLFFNLQLSVRGREGSLSLYNFDYYPVVVSSVGVADLLLPSLAGGKDRFRIDYRQGEAWLVSATPLIVNGLPRREKQLRPGDRIIFGSYRLEFKNASIQEQALPAPRKPALSWQFPVVTVLLALALLFRQAVAVPSDAVVAKAAALQESKRGAGPKPPADVSAHIAKPARELPALRSSKEPELPKSESAKAANLPAAVASVPAVESREDLPRKISREPVSPAASPVPQAKPQVAAVLSKAEAPAASQEPAAQPKPEESKEPAAQPVPPAQMEADPAAPATRPEPVTATAALVSAASPKTETPDERPVAAVAAARGIDGERKTEATARSRAVPQPRRTDVRVIAPGRPIDYFAVDILFIHAHPDDESIDFGTLMSRASRSGKRIVTLLFTDGEAGLDLYPQRKIGDIYPARPLKGEALSQVRVVEATRALSILGAELYIRWGLRNRPYNTQRDVVPPKEVIRGWGGEEELVGRLIEVLEGFRPRVVVSPDGRSAAHEHFEHEAVGYLVAKALQQLRLDGRDYVKGHLVSVDPFQQDRYTGLVGVDSRLADPESGLAHRDIQILALREHVSQRDASVIAVNRLSRFPGELYKVRFWELSGSVAEYLH